MRIDRPENEANAEAQFYRELNVANDFKTPTPTMRLEELEAGCRVIRMEMVKQGDKHREQLLYRFELIARRAQLAPKNPEWWASTIYAAISDYGSNLLRPIKAWLWLISISGLIYALYKAFFYTTLSEMISSTPGTRLKALVDAYGYAFNRALPLSFWPEKSDFVKDITCISPFWHFLFNCLSMWESVFSAVLIFLFFLALRRRFQIN